MLASELIKRLQALIENAGDQPVVPVCDDDGEDVVQFSRTLNESSNPLIADDKTILLYVSLPVIEEDEDQGEDE